MDDIFYDIDTGVLAPAMKAPDTVELRYYCPIALRVKDAAAPWRETTLHEEVQREPRRGFWEKKLREAMERVMDERGMAALYNHEPQGERYTSLRRYLRPASVTVENTGEQLWAALTYTVSIGKTIPMETTRDYAAIHLALLAKHIRSHTICHGPLSYLQFEPDPGRLSLVDGITVVSENRVSLPGELAKQQDMQAGQEPGMA